MNLPAAHALRIAPLDGVLDVHAAMALLTNGEDVCLLESGAGPEHIARYSYLCFEPIARLRAKRRECHFDSVRMEGPFFDVLETLLGHYRALVQPPGDPTLPPFLGGFVGALGYELLHELEEVPDLGTDALALPDAALLLPGAVIAVDLVARKSWLISHGFASQQTQAERQAEERERRLLPQLAHLPPAIAPPLLRRPREALREQDVLAAGFTPVLSRAQYLDVVRAAREEILAGNVFEICTTTRFDAVFPGSGRDLLASLRRLHPAPFSGYLQFGDAELICASPERFLKLDPDRWAETRPIKGTRPRGRTPEEDEALRDELARSEKDRAENVMIVDLARNDLGRVCELCSVSVPRLFDLEAHPFTHQLVSTIRGRLREELGPVDLLRASFPGGSMTGAPKIEAMRIIERLEPVNRGLYAGTLGWLDFRGALDLNIVIRSFLKRGEHLAFHVGGAVVADSDPEAEYQELLDKAHGLIAAFNETRS